MARIIRSREPRQPGKPLTQPYLEAAIGETPAENEGEILILVDPSGRTYLVVSTGDAYAFSQAPVAMNPSQD